MKIIEKFIPLNGFSRPGRKRTVTKGIVLHNVGVAGQRATEVIHYFSGLAAQNAMDNKPDVSASAQYIIDQDGTIYQCMPDDEKAYHVGSSIKDPASGLIYTDLARDKFGSYAANPLTSSPNSCCVGIELCHEDHGRFTPETLFAAKELCLWLMKKYKLGVNSVMTHHDVVGWKECPILWCITPQLFTDFKANLI